MAGIDPNDKTGGDEALTKEENKRWNLIGGFIIFFMGLVFAVMSLAGTIVRLRWYLPLISNMNPTANPYSYVITWTISAILIVAGYLLMKQK